MTLLLLNGSLRATSLNGAVLRTIGEVAPQGVHVHQYAGMSSLPHFNPDDDQDPLPPAVTDLRSALASADAVLICTPEYAGALPGAFKNLLDWLVGGTEMNGKPVAWVNVSTNTTAARDAHAELRRVLAYLNARVIKDACVHLPVPRQIIADGCVSDVKMRQRLAQTVGLLREALR